MQHNVCMRVLDATTGRVIQSHTGHNSATNSLMLGIGYYLSGEGVLNQGSSTLINYLPQYISLGTMGLHGQSQDENGLPTDIGNAPEGSTEEDQYQDYMQKRPGFGADGYSSVLNNGRSYFGLGLPVTTYDANKLYAVGAVVTYRGVTYQRNPIDPEVAVTGPFNPVFWTQTGSLVSEGYELVSPSSLRAKISYRSVVPEQYAEQDGTIDIVFSAMVSTRALAQFRDDTDYIFITEAGLWATPQWTDSGENGLLAGYRIVPPDQINWDMTVPENREILQKNILRVGLNQVVQVIWKIQLKCADPESDAEVEDRIYAELLQQQWGN